MKGKVTPGVESNTGAYSPGLVVGEMVFVSGQGALEGKDHAIVGTTIAEQATKTLENVRAILNAAGCEMNDCVKVTSYLKDMRDFDAYDAAYRKFFTQPYPARSTVQAGLSEGLLVEIDAIAIRGCGSK